MSPLQRLSDSSGATLVIVAIWLPILILFCTFVLDLGNWFEHKRHLQTQADAGALAAGGSFNACFGTGTSGSTQVENIARKYAGDPGAASAYNSQVGGSNRGGITVRINSKTYAVGGPGPDDTVEAPPCQAKMVDVKATEADLPLFFGLVPNFLNKRLLPAINAHARIEIRNATTSKGALPVGVPDVNPKIGRVQFLDESNGNALLGSAPLVNTGSAGGLSIWDNGSAPVPLTVNTDKIGVRVIFGGAASTTCGDVLVSCFDQVLFIQGWSSAGNAAQPNPPLVRSVSLFNGTCTDPYFSAPGAACTIGVRANVDFGTGANDPTLGTAPGVGATLKATINGTTQPLTYSSATHDWSSAAGAMFSLPPQAGPLKVDLAWADTRGTVSGNTCRTNGSNRCTGTFTSVQRTFTASDGASGPIQLAQVWESGGFWVNSLQRTTSHNLVVKVGIKASLGNASAVSDPVVSLRVVGGSQNQSLDCDPGYSNLKDELAQGCRPTYSKNTGTPCPGNASALWGSAQPWPCVALQTGSATNQVPEGLNTRVLGDPKPKTCPAAGQRGHNNWSMFPNFPPGDPRIVQVFLTPFGSFSGSGSDTVPVTGFASFYVTGWTAQGGGFANPCQGNGDDPVPNNDAGYIVGHFIKYIESLNSGGGGPDLCDFNAFGNCVAVLTK
jgi:putative Flp pilus-assembly TadE/G-like protein